MQDSVVVTKLEADFNVVRGGVVEVTEVGFLDPGAHDVPPLNDRALRIQKLQLNGLLVVVGITHAARQGLIVDADPVHDLLSSGRSDRIVRLDVDRVPGLFTGHITLRVDVVDHRLIER